MSVIIIGGGMTGATLALAISYLTKGKLPVHLVEAVAPQIKDHPSFNARAIALTRGTCQHLMRIGIWQAITCCATPIKNIHISDRRHFGSVVLDAKNYYLDTLGQVIEPHKFGLCLFNLLNKAPGITLHCPAKVTDITRSKYNVSVTLCTGTVLNKGLLLVAADGSYSKIALKCGIEYQQKSYNQIAVIANISTDINHNRCAWERFTEHGPIAMLPISGGRYSLVWCHSIDKKNEILSWSDEYFCAELQKFFGWRLGRIICTSKRTFYPLSLIIAKKFIAHRIVLVGNAAQTLHPIAGQGFNLGLRDIIKLTEILIRAWSLQQDFGSYSILNHYQQCRKLDRELTINLTDNLVTLFSNNCFPLVLGRNMGLIVMKLFTPLRNILLKYILN